MSQQPPMAPGYPMRSLLFMMAVLGFCWIETGCKKSTPEGADDSDANGYICTQCNAKLYTARSVFIGPKCPKCQQDALMSLAAYKCDKDKQVIMRPSRGDRLGTPTCDVCKADLSKTMFLPRE